MVVVGDGASATTMAAFSSFRFQLLSMLLRLLLTLSLFSRIPSHVILRKGIIVAGGRHLIRAFVNCSFRAAMQLAAVFFCSCACSCFESFDTYPATSFAQHGMGMKQAALLGG